MPATEKIISTAEVPSLPICYLDDHYVAIDKPAGLLVHRTKIAEEQHLFALNILQKQVGKKVYPVHRIDRATSGLLLFALSGKDATSVQTQFQSGVIKKEYLAIVRGYLPESGQIEEPLEKHDKGVLQQAITYYKTLGKAEVPIAVNKYATSRYSFVRLMPKTGRRHQLRRHFNHFGHPIIGDTTYGDLRHNRMFEKEMGIKRLLLHAYSLEFTHPISGEAVKLIAKLPVEFYQAANYFNWNQDQHTTL